MENQGDREKYKNKQIKNNKINNKAVNNVYSL